MPTLWNWTQAPALYDLFMANRIGITMRVTRSRHGETRDCLAREWASYMASTLPEASWVPLPNVGESVVEQAAQ